MAWLTEPPMGAIMHKKGPNPSRQVYRVVPTDASICKARLYNVDSGWFAPMKSRTDGHYGWGFIFDNYFHALAYSLKLRAKLKEKDHV